MSDQIDKLTEHKQRIEAEIKIRKLECRCFFFFTFIFATKTLLFGGLSSGDDECKCAKWDIKPYYNMHLFIFFFMAMVEKNDLSYTKIRGIPDRQQAKGIIFSIDAESIPWLENMDG